VYAFVNEAIADVAAGIEFWKTIAGNRRLKHGFSSEFMSRNG
jgi:hypothetical protein